MVSPNPYTGATVFDFLLLLFGRLGAFLLGTPLEMAQDEVQLLTLCAVALCASLVGVFLVLREMTLLANALTHTTLFGIVSVYLLQYALTGVISSHLSMSALIGSALVSALLTTLTTEGLHRLFHLQEDACVGLVFSFYFALGVTMLSLFSRNTHLGTELITGNADAIVMQDLLLSSGVFLVNLCTILFLYRGLKFSTFDPLGSRLAGYSPLLLNFVLMLLTSLTCVSALRAVGALPLLVFITLPPLCARLFTHSLPSLLLLAMGSAVGAAALGVAVSRHLFTVLGYGLSTGGVITTLYAFLYISMGAFLHLRRSVRSISMERSVKRESSTYS